MRLRARLEHFEGLPVTMVTVTLGAEARIESELVQLDWLHQSLAALNKRLRWSGYYAIEATWTGRGANIHAHLLLLGALYLKLGSFKELLVDSMLGQVCYVSTPKKSLRARSGAAYLTKYVTKTGMASPATWRGRRLFGSFGSAWGAPYKTISQNAKISEVEYETHLHGAARYSAQDYGPRETESRGNFVFDAGSSDSAIGRRGARGRVRRYRAVPVDDVRAEYVAVDELPREADYGEGL